MEYTSIYGYIKISRDYEASARYIKNLETDETTYTKALRSLLKKKPDILLIHLSPMISEKNLQGEILLTTELQNAGKTIVFCGHSHWYIIEPQITYNATQILNADTKVYI